MARRAAVLSLITAATVCAVPVAASAAPAAPAASAAAVHHGTRVLTDCVHAQREPSRIIVACGDGTVAAVSLQYGSWTPTEARGHGALLVNLCEPDCAHGNTRRTPMHFALSEPRRSKVGQLFSLLVVRYANGTHETYHLLTRPF